MFVPMLRSRNSLNSSSVISVGSPLTARLFCLFFAGLEGLRETNLNVFTQCSLHFTFILPSFCKIITSCSESPIATKSPFGSSLILKILKLGWYCFNSPVSFLRDFMFSSTPPIMTRIVFFLQDLGRTGVPRGGSEEPGLAWLESVGELLALRFLLLLVASMNPSP